MHKALVGALLLALAFAPSAAHAKNDKKNPFASIPVTGTVPGTSDTFAGMMDVLGFTNGVDSAGKPTVEAIGVLNGTLAGMPVTNQVITWPIAVTDPPSCSILNLVLGPLHLNLLGLNVDLNQVVLNITAQPGAGNLLGNLLCAITNLLNGAAVGPILTTLLNNLTTLLAGLGL